MIAIDGQHKGMLSLINEIDEVIQEGGTYEQFAPVLDEDSLITRTAISHMKKNYWVEPIIARTLERHKKSHVRLREELSRWQEKVTKADSGRNE